MNQNKPAVVKKLQERFRNVSVGRGLYMAFVMPTMLSMFSTRAFAADTIWTKASAIMQDVYKQILSISTIAAVVTAAVALLLMNFSRSGRTVDESRAWLKRIIITWASVLTVIVGCLASGSVSLIVLILVIIIAWNYIKLLFEAAERYILVGVLIYTAPIAFATGASESTSNVFSAWCRMKSEKFPLSKVTKTRAKPFMRPFGSIPSPIMEKRILPIRSSTCQTIRNSLQANMRKT